MKYAAALLLGLFILWAGCKPAPQEVLLDSFEGLLGPETVDFGASEKSSLKVEASNAEKVCGEQALKFEYDLKPSGYMWVARGYNIDVRGAGAWLILPQDVAWQKYDTLSVYMYGSNSGGVVAFDFKDSGGEMWRFLLDDDFSGWKEINCPFEQFFVRSDWQPENATRNEILDFPIMSFQFEPRLPGKGVYYFDCIKVKRLKASICSISRIKSWICRVFPKKSS